MTGRSSRRAPPSRKASVDRRSFSEGGLARRSPASVRRLFLPIALAAGVVLAAQIHDWRFDGPLLPHPATYYAARAASPPKIDGQLDDPAWKTADLPGFFRDIEGSVRPDPKYRTTVMMLWDDTYFYIGAELEEPHLWATLTEHDAVIFRDNDFEVFIDPNGDNHEYGELEINALGTTWDLFLPKPYRDDGKAVNGWEIAGMKTAVHLDGTLNNPADIDRGWTVELALPWKALGEIARMPSPPRNGNRWRVNFSRVQWQLRVVDGKYVKVPDTKENNWVWSPQGAVDMHRPERWGYVEFVTTKPGLHHGFTDPDRPAQDYLHRVYYAQREFRRKAGRWAETFDELGLTTVPPPRPFMTPQNVYDARLSVAGSLYEASVAMSPTATERWYIRQDSLVWKK